MHKSRNYPRKNPYTSIDREEWKDSIGGINGDLRDVLQKIWMNRYFLNRKDIDKLQHFANKGLT